MSSANKDEGGRYPATVWRKRRKARRVRPNDDSDFHPLVRDGVFAARIHLLEQQDSESGGWIGQMPLDPHVTAEYMLLLYWLGLADDAERPIAQMRAFIIDSVNSDAVWSAQSDATDVSTSTLCYLALKLSGSDPSDPFMNNVREGIRSRGGADVVNGLTRFYLSLFGQDSFDRCPPVPPEFILLPRWLPLSLTRWSRWARAILVPLSVLWALRPTKEFGAEANLDELFLAPSVRTKGRYEIGIAGARKWRARWSQFTARVAGAITEAVERGRYSAVSSAGDTDGRAMVDRSIG